MPKVPLSTGTVTAAAISGAKKKLLGGSSVGAVRAEEVGNNAWKNNGTVLLLPMHGERAQRSLAIPTAAAAIASIGVIATGKKLGHDDANQTATTSYPNTNSAQNAGTKKMSVTASLVAGTTAGVVTTLVLYPLDVWKTRVQASPGSKSSVEILRRMIRHEGYASLYTGVTFPLLAQGMYTATAFGVKNLTQGLLTHYRSNGNPSSSSSQRHVDTFICGAIGGGTKGALLCTPVEFVRNQSIVSLGSESMVGILRSTVQSGQVARLWTGVGITVARDSVGWGTLFCAYEVCREGLAPLFFEGDRNALGNCALSGALASVAYSAAVMPLDTIKTLIQTSAPHHSQSRAMRRRPHYTNVTSTILHLWHQEGQVVQGVVQRLYRGFFTVGLGRYVWGGAFTFGIYAAVERAL